MASEMEEEEEEVVVAVAVAVAVAVEVGAGGKAYKVKSGARCPTVSGPSLHRL